MDDKKLAGFWYSMTTWTSTRAVLWSNRVGWPWPGRVGLALGLGLVLALDTWVLWGQWGLWDAAGNLLHLQVVRDGNLQVARDLMAAQVVRDLKGAHPAGKVSKAVERDGMVVRDGKVAKDGKVVARDGKVVARDGKVVARDGKVVARDGKVVVRDGKVVARDGGAARDGEDLALVLACLAATAMRPSCIDDSYNEKVLNLSLSLSLSVSFHTVFVQKLRDLRCVRAREVMGALFCFAVWRRFHRQPEVTFLSSHRNFETLVCFLNPWVPFNAHLHDFSWGRMGIFLVMHLFARSSSVLLDLATSVIGDH